jgi:HlyD family secretion protein
VEVTTDNSSGRLLPYMTANVQFEVNRADDVLQVPNAALRYTPRPDAIAPDAREAEKTAEKTPEEGGSARPASAGSSAGAPTSRPGSDRPRGQGRRRNAAASDPTTSPSYRPGKVWVKEGQYVRPVMVRAGLTDGTNTEVQGEGLKEGAEVVVGEVIAMTQGTGQTTNPFAPPQMRGGPRGGGGGARGGGTRGG